MNPEKKKGNFSLFLYDLVCGGGATAISRTLVAPLERIKIVLQTQKLASLSEKDRFKGFFDALIRIPREQGFFSFWRGNWSNVFRIIPVNCIRFTTYDTLKRMSMPKGEYAYEGFERIFRKMEVGFIGGVITMILTYPFDVIRTRMAMDLTTPNEKRLYKGIFDCVKKSVRSEGFFSLYSGFWVSVLGSIPHIAISLGLYETLRDHLLNQPENKDDTLSQVVSYVGLGTIAGFAAGLITYPFDTIRRRMQLNGSLGSEKFYKNSLDCVRKMIAKEGVTSFYLGLVPHLIKVAPAAAIQFSMYDFLKQNIVELNYV